MMPFVHCQKYNAIFYLNGIVSHDILWRLSSKFSSNTNHTHLEVFEEKIQYVRSLSPPAPSSPNPGSAPDEMDPLVNEAHGMMELLIPSMRWNSAAGGVVWLWPLYSCLNRRLREDGWLCRQSCWNLKDGGAKLRACKAPSFGRLVRVQVPLQDCRAMSPEIPWLA